MIEENHAVIDSYLGSRGSSEVGVQNTMMKAVKCFRCNGNHYQSNCKTGTNVKCYNCGGAHGAVECMGDQEFKNGFNKRVSYVFCLERESGVLRVLVNGHEVSALVDTGADRSFIKEKFFRCIEPRI